MEGGKEGVYKEEADGSVRMQSRLENSAYAMLRYYRIYGYCAVYVLYRMIWIRLSKRHLSASFNPRQLTARQKSPQLSPELAEQTDNLNFLTKCIYRVVHKKVSP